MKKTKAYILLYLCLAFLSANGAFAATIHSFAASSVMNTGKWVKIRVPETGIYKITYDQIRNQGLDPADIHIYGYGGTMLSENFSQSKTDDLPQVAIYNSGSYILFYAQGSISWQYNTAKQGYEHTVNPYSTYGYYFLASGVSGEPQKTIPLAGIVSPNETPTEVSEFTDHFLYEKDLVNLTHSGRVFYGETFGSSSSTNNKTFTFNINNLASSAKAVIEFDGAINSIFAGTAAADKSSFGIYINNSLLFTKTADNIKPDDNHVRGTVSHDYREFYPTGSPINVKVVLNKSPRIDGASGWLNYIRITAKRQLTMNGNAMFFRAPDISSYKKFNLQTGNGNLKIWDITNPNSIQEIQKNYADGKISFIADKNEGNNIREFVALDANASFPAPEFVGEVPNQNLHAADNREFVIICHPDFLPQAERLARAHLEKDNISTLIVTPEQVYNEFSSGTPDATAYRWLMKMFYERKNAGVSNTETKYLLLFGDGSYDNRQILSPADGNNKLLVYESEASLMETSLFSGDVSYVSDDYFGFLDDEEGVFPYKDALDIGIGRFPVTTPEQAEGVVNKTIKYMNNKNLGAWKNQMCYVGDDGDGGLHQTQAETLANTVINQYPDFQVIKMYFDAYQQQKNSSGESYPEVVEKLQNLIKRGLLMLNYTGHGSTGTWANERVMTTDMIKAMYNENLAMWVTATCDFSRYDSRDLTAGEWALLNPNGGSIALLTTTRTVYSDRNSTLNKAFVKNVFLKDNEGKRLRLGEIIKRTKLDSTLSNDANKLNFTLLGDPALTLTYPAHEVVTDSVNGVAADEETNVAALDIVTLKGHIANEDNGTLISDFNGIVTVTVFDKEESKQTLNNDGDSGVMTFKERPTLFSGKAEVVNGEFSLTFMLPKDINYSAGIGKILYYAGDTINDYEAHGYHENFIIGGSGSGNFDDNEGPVIDMYLNTPTFNSGDRVNPTPLFVARLSDENGINIIGNGIGHDIVIMLDNDNQKWTVLNDYFESDLGTYQSGTVRYKLPIQTNGKHTLTFRAWDLLNNSSSATLDFEVINGLSVGIIEAYCYPNPARDYVQFVLEHDRPDAVLDVTVHVFDLAGRELWNYNSDFYTSGNTLYIKEWDLTTHSGQKIGKGIYLFKIDVVSSNEKMSSKTQKIIVQ